ncbi:MAG: AmmeMemoRadiSam system protein B [Planctomycetes bacterium]|nr:AmmeMemoRadiSam system protein B [Planctomycetota bacterium]NOG55058.1 AmmeMemoRadiSam system protein B [Planctomycetota bacterium]
MNQAVTRQPAVSGLFYPGDRSGLQQTVSDLLADAPRSHMQHRSPKALIAPHAGYDYSGLPAAIAFATLEPIASTIRRVILIGPSHRVAFSGIATSGADCFATPLGMVVQDAALRETAEELPYVTRLDEAHAQEHSLEVELPFLQSLLPAFTFVPLVVGDATADEVAAVLAGLWGDDDTIIIVSSDLSHFLSYGQAREIDRATANAIESLAPQAISSQMACGHQPIKGLLTLARTRTLTAQTLALMNSGDTSGSRDRVVGYGAFAFYEPEPSN